MMRPWTRLRSLALFPPLLFLLVLAMQSALASRQVPPMLAVELWHTFASRFIDNGRVVDRDNGYISHSEGQGYGMLLAEAADEPERFAQLWQWTQANLMRDDHLLSWRWEPNKGITDSNNATDGDILVAWALLRAAQRWNNEKYRQAAKLIISAIHETLLLERNGRLYLLPGSEGFISGSELMLNPSYYIFPAFEAFARVDTANTWYALIDSGKSLIEDAGVAPSGLVPDWVVLSANGYRPASLLPPRFSWNAVRVPLYLVWHERDPRQLLSPYIRFWNRYQRSQPPAWIDLTTGQTAGYPAPTGILAVATLAKMTLSDRIELPTPTAQDGYFSTTLTLLAHLAAADIKSREP